MPYLVFSEYHKEEDLMPPEENERWGLKDVKEEGQALEANGADDRESKSPLDREKEKKDEQKQQEKDKEEEKKVQQENEIGKAKRKTRQQKWRKLKEKNDAHEALREAYSKDVVHRCPTLDESYYHFEADNEEAEKDRQYRNRTQIVTKSAKKAVREKRQREEGGEEEPKEGGSKDGKNLKDKMRQGLRSRAERWTPTNAPRPGKGEKDEKVTQDPDKDPYWPILSVDQLWVWAVGES